MTIEERAQRYHEKLIAENPATEAWAFDLAYEVGAKDQQKIDIEKACEWLKVNWHENNGRFIFAIGDFYKAMEE